MCIKYMVNKFKIGHIHNIFLHEILLENQLLIHNSIIL